MPRLSGDELLPGTITDEPTPLGRMTPSPSPPPPYPEPEQERDQDTAPLLPAPITHTGPQAPLCDPLLFACTDIAWLDAGLCCETIGAAFHCCAEVFGALGHACVDAIPALLGACEGFGACCNGW